MDDPRSAGHAVGRGSQRQGEGMRRSRFLRLLFVAVGTSCLAVLAAATTASAQGNRHRLPGTKPSWTSAVQQAGTVPAADLVHAKVWLAPRNSAQLDALATAVSD